MRQKDTIDKAYGNIPKEVTSYINFDFLLFRPIKYIWLTKIIRKFFR